MFTQKTDLETHSTQSKSPQLFLGLFLSPFKKIKASFRRLGIRQKITYGYTITLGIAILGTVMGYGIEEIYKSKARQQLDFAQQQAQLILRLQDAILEAKSNRHQIMFSLDKPFKFKQQHHRVLQNLAQAKFWLMETQKLMELRRIKLHSSYHFNDSNDLKKSIDEYNIILSEYAQKLDQILRKIEENPPTTPEEIEDDQRLLIGFSNTEIYDKFTQMSRDLLEIVENFKNEEREEFADYREAELMGSIIRIGSLLISMVIAVISAIYTSREIARPLEVTTKLAQKVTQESNFDLQAPVTTEDEVGLLTTSLNQLIQRVATYTRELQQAQTQLIQTEKMSSLGNMVAGIAHEINNPVSFIYGNLSHTEEYMEQLLNLLHLFREQYPHPNPLIQREIEVIDLDFIEEDLPKTLESMKNGAERIRQLVLSLRNFSRLDESERKKADIHQGLESTLMILNNRMGTEIKIIKDYQLNLPLIECYPAQINQVFMNLLSNSIDALLMIPEKLDKWISIKTEKLNNEGVKVIICDNAMGIPLEIQDKVFDPFFTTKPVGRGTGLGLSIAYDIIRQHQGTITLSSTAGEGTEFTITLPISLSLTVTESSEFSPVSV